MDITILPPVAGHGVYMVVAGELDFATAGHLTAELDAVLGRRPDQVQVDLSAVTFLSCAAARVLRDAHQRATGPVTLVGVTRPVRRLLEIMQLQSLLGHPRSPAEPHART
jgi:anti-anti-sigma factor